MQSQGDICNFNKQLNSISAGNLDLTTLLTQIRSYRIFKVINYIGKDYILMKVSLKYGSSKISKNGLVSKSAANQCIWFCNHHWDLHCNNCHDHWMCTHYSWLPVTFSTTMPLITTNTKDNTNPWCIHRVKWRHISAVAIRSPFCRSRPSYCA